VAGRNSETGPASSQSHIDIRIQSASEAQLHVSAQMGGGGREARSAFGAVGAELATQVLGARAAAVAIAVRGVYEGIPVMQSLVQIAIGQRPARAGRSPRSRSRRCSLRTRRRAAVVAEGVGGVETRPLARPEGNAKEVTRRRRRVTTAALRDDSVVAHGSLPAAWSD